MKFIDMENKNSERKKKSKQSKKPSPMLNQVSNYIAFIIALQLLYCPKPLQYFLLSMPQLS